jgi:hypothetical protein
MKRETFILKKTKPFRYFTNIYLKSEDGKTEKRNVTFTTEHKVSEKQRNKNARKINAELSTNDEKVYDGLLRSPAYGKTFVLKGDDEGKLKKEPFNITPLDAKKIALKNLFEAAGLEFDSEKSPEVLEEEYRIFASAITGINIKKNGPAEIHHVPVDVEQQLLEHANTAREAYKAKYKEDVPDEYKNDLGFLSALSDPKFDAKAYMEKAEGDVADEPKTDKEYLIEDLQAKYFDKFKVNVANAKKNDAAWIKKKLEE